MTEPTDRDVIIGEGSAGHKSNYLLQDMILLHKVVWKLQGKADPKKEADVKEISSRIVKLLKEGKRAEFATLREVPYAFTKGPGKFLTNSGTAWKEMTQADAVKAVSKVFLEEYKKDAMAELDKAPYKDLKDSMTQKTDKNLAIIPDPKDVILLPVGDDAAGDKLYDSQGGNRTLFSLASQLVTTFTNSADRRVEAALAIMKGLDDQQIDDKDKVAQDPHARFLLRNSDETIGWTRVGALEAAELTVVFVFEVFLEKEIYIAAAQGGVLPAEKDIVPASEEPVPDPIEHDVLFGRGGMTNSHLGNRKFREIIALHRPDYIRAIKMDKPNVARKIVRSIRNGNPPGRFLKKGDDGHWYDVGDRAAAEKTSQGLRERTNAEKRQRSALREALKIRRQDMAEGDTPGKKPRLDTALQELTAATAPILNYVGTNLAAPLSLNMKEQPKTNMVKKKAQAGDEFATAGLPGNAVDEDGNILVTDYDILCGRGGLTNHHRGNKRFREIVAMHRGDYVRAPKIQKPSVARVIVRAILNADPPGRFLRKDEATGKWVQVDQKKAAEKTSQALREKSGDEREKTKAATGTMLVPNNYLDAVPMALVPPGVTMGLPSIAPAVPAAAAVSVDKESEPKKGSQEGKAEDDEAKELLATDEGNLSAVV